MKNNRRDLNPRRQVSERRLTERRLEPREPFEAGIRFLRAGSSVDEILSGELVDVSASGIRVLLNEPLEQRQKILVEVRGESEDCFNLLAEAIWIEHLPSCECLIGCELCVELSRRQFARLQELATGCYVS